MPRVKTIFKEIHIVQNQDPCMEGVIKLGFWSPSPIYGNKPNLVIVLILLKVQTNHSWSHERLK